MVTLRMLYVLLTRTEHILSLFCILTLHFALLKRGHVKHRLDNLFKLMLTLFVIGRKQLGDTP